MGKKIRTQDSITPPDVFDKVLLESHQAVTVVLMLESPEDDVVIKALASIYCFSEKCDENKLTLLSIESIVDRLLNLLLHDDRIIRRNACMAIASISQHPDARKYLRKFKCAIPRIVELISTEVDAVIHEFGILCLASLVVDFSSKMLLCQCGGLTPIVACLSSHDPDVCKNSIETLALIMQDYEAKMAFREIPDGFSAVMLLLKSEFPIIQHQALVTLTLAAEDVENRAILHDLGIVQQTMDYLGKPETRDLHGFAVMLMSNCIDDPRTLKLFKDAGGLQLLVSFLADKQVTSDEEKTKEKEVKSKKDKASRTPRNRDRDAAASTADDEKLRAKGISEPNIAVMPDMKEHAAKAIARCAQCSNCRKILHEAEVEKKLITLLAQDKTLSAVPAVAALAIGAMAQHDASRDAINKWGGIEPLVKLASGKNDNPDILAAVSLALANLAVNNPNNCSELLKYGALGVLIPLLASSHEMTASHAATALANMAPHSPLSAEMIRLEAVVALTDAAANTESTLVQSRALWAIGALVINMQAQNQFVETEGLKTLIRLVQSGHSTVCRNASWVVSLLSTDEALAFQMCKMGCLEALQQIQFSVSRRNRFSEVALSKLYDAQLVTKYAYTGTLGATNIIADGFYDTGRLKAQDVLLSLDDYGKEKRNDQRTVVVINPRPETPVSAISIPEVEPLEKTSKLTVTATGRSSRTSGREPKSKRGQKEPKEPKEAKGADTKEKDDKHAVPMERQPREDVQAAVMASTAVGLQQKDAAAAADKVVITITAVEQRVFVIPSDPALLHYIENITEQIQPLASVEEQAVALAKFVSEKMGGVVASDKLSSYQWQVHIDQLKQMVDCNVLPIGLIKTGFFCHRALLFKVLADRIGLPSALVRGDYNRAWNEIILPTANADEMQQIGMPLNPKVYIVDIMFEPGRFIDTCSCEAVAYMSAHVWTTDQMAAVAVR